MHLHNRATEGLGPYGCGRRCSSLVHFGQKDIDGFSDENCLFVVESAGAEHASLPTAYRRALLVLVEDEQLLHLSLEDALSEGGFEVKLARNGVDGLALLENHKDTVEG
jgi:hypothetical protein